MIARHYKRSWIPNEEDWHGVLAAVRQEPIRNRVLLAFAYDVGLRREELCSLRDDDIAPSRCTLRGRAAFSASSSKVLLKNLQHRRTLGRRGPLFLSASRSNYTERISIWSRSKVVLTLARRAQVERFNTHGLRPLFLTDLVRSSYDMHEIAPFACQQYSDCASLYPPQRPRLCCEACDWHGSDPCATGPDTGGDETMKPKRVRKVSDDDSEAFETLRLRC
jgi:integrase/recombinase XerD